MLNLDDNPNCCLSGGADGADLEWGMAADQLGHGVVHFSFAGHKTHAPAHQLVLLSNEQLTAADPYCHAANKTLCRRFPIKSINGTNLLRRNWYQVTVAPVCYSVSTLAMPPGPTIPLDIVVTGQVQGGTAWAVQMFIDRHKGRACPCYLFDQIAAQWFQWNGDGWRCIYEPPTPVGVYAAIGSRDLRPIGRTAIRVTMNYKNLHDDSAFRRPLGG